MQDKIPESQNPLEVFEKSNKIFLTIVIIISILGIILSSYLAYLHFEPSASKLCIIGENFDCDVVNKSTYSQLFGIPVAILGGLTYLLFLIIAMLLLKDYDFSKIGKLIDEPITQTTAYYALFVTAIIALGFSIYLTYVEAYILKTYCIFCLVSLTFIIILFIIMPFSINTHKKIKKHKIEYW